MVPHDGAARKSSKEDRFSVIKQRSDERLAERIAKEIVYRYQGRGVVDVGCGDGVVKNHLNKDTFYLGLDISDACIYQKNSSDNAIKYIEKTDLRLELRNNCSDRTVLLLDVLEHTRDFLGLFVDAIEGGAECIVVSLPNELFIADRLRMLSGHELNAHSLDLLRLPEGFKHQYIVNITKARNLLTERAESYAYRMVEEVRRELIPKELILKPAMKLLKAVTSPDVWSMGSIFVFCKGN